MNFYKGRVVLLGDAAHSTTRILDKVAAKPWKMRFILLVPYKSTPLV